MEMNSAGNGPGGAGFSRNAGGEIVLPIEVRPRLLDPLKDKVAIEFASLGGDAGYIGAAGLARLEHRRKH